MKALQGQRLSIDFYYKFLFFQGSLMSSRHHKTVLITGCSSGIGRALAIEAHKQGYHVIATARRVERLEDLQKQGIDCLPLDVNDSEAIINIRNNFINSKQPIDFIINNAGVGAMIPMSDIPMQALQQQFQTNVFSIVNLINTLLPLLSKQKKACIINIGSVSGVLTTPFAGAYCASKAALHSISEAYRMELAPFGIDVVTVQPGAIASSFGDNASKVTHDLIKADSPYRNIESAIRRRAKASQEKPSSAEDFAKTLLAHMKSERMPAVIRIGNGSTLLPLLPRILPARVLDKILSKPFQLNKLKK